MNIRHANLTDAAQIAEIYNFYIENTHHTFETKPISVVEMQSRIEMIIKNYPYLVCQENDEIIGYAYAAQYKPRPAYKHSVEISIYVKSNLKQKGIGKILYERLFDELSKTDIHAIIAGIALPNEASIKLHENFGFEKVAHFREVGFKSGKWIDVGYWELLNQKL
ncbi:MAG: arsinothricin resistance N-acetyltransferase ArsN1 family B [Pyrinomonadaceae bacterium]